MCSWPICGARLSWRSPVFDDAGLERPTPLTGLPCLLASDCRITGGRPQEIVPIRSVIEAVAAAPARVTLVALDLGDLDWDPRLGVLGQVVPAALDRELAKPQIDAVSQNWIIGSHDLFQASAVSVQSRRTCFGRALELALAGDADEEATGNGNGLIELDEVVRFVSLWTNEWTRRLSGGRSRQTPVVWKLGVGRVAPDEIPPGIALLRVPSRSSFFATSKPQAEAARGDESSAAEAASGPQASEKQKDAASGEETPQSQQDDAVERLPCRPQLLQRPPGTRTQKASRPKAARLRMPPAMVQRPGRPTVRPQACDSWLLSMNPEMPCSRFPVNRSPWHLRRATRLAKIRLGRNSKNRHLTRQLTGLPPELVTPRLRGLLVRRVIHLRKKRSRQRMLR